MLYVPLLIAQCILKKTGNSGLKEITSLLARQSCRDGVFSSSDPRNISEAMAIDDLLCESAINGTPSPVFPIIPCSHNTA